jgi:hypothetical protein
LSFPTSRWFFELADYSSPIAVRRKRCTVQRSKTKTPEAGSVPDRLRWSPNQLPPPQIARLGWQHRLKMPDATIEFFAGVKSCTDAVNVNGLGGCQMTLTKARGLLSKYTPNRDFF